MERGRVELMKTTHIIPIMASLALIGAGCTQSNVLKEVSRDTAGVTQVNEGNLAEKSPSDLCNMPLTSTLYERPRLLPNQYPNLEALGPLFTASECRDARLRQLLGEKDPNAELTLDQVIVLKTRSTSEDLRKHLQQAGFLCAEDLVTDGCYTRQAGTRVQDLLTLKPFADQFAGEYFEDTYTAYDQQFSFQNPIDPKSTICTSAANETVADQYAVYDAELGALFTQYQCTSGHTQMKNGLYNAGVDLSLKQAPSQKLLQTLRTIGFVCASEGESEELCTHWKLLGAVPIKRLIHLEPYTAEVNRTDCVNCG